MDGTHTIERSEAVTSAALQALYAALDEQRVFLEGSILKPNMVLSGYECSSQATDAEVAERTVRTFLRHVPAAVPGVVFLSGGQSDEQATARLNEMNKLGSHPWELSFSYGRALQAPTLKAWKGEASNVGAAQSAFEHRAKMNSAARSGSYTADMEKAA
jgi:fructose-bisphosphate aldolase class I